MVSCISYTAKLKTVGEINIYQAKNDFIAIYYIGPTVSVAILNWAGRGSI